MNYLQSDLGHLPQGSAIEVTLRGSAANVLLLDAANLSSYKRGAGFSYADGGFFERSPAMLGIPRSGHWHVIVDLNGGSGRVDAAVRVLAGR